MNDAGDDADTLDPSPDKLILTYLGTITMAWSMVEAIVSAALFSKLNLDEIEFTLLLGRLEVLPKLQKLNQILTHLKDVEGEKLTSDIYKRVEKLRPDRNALTHGVYQGRSGRGEYAFYLTADILFEDGQPPAKTMRVFTSDTLEKHVNQVNEIFLTIQSAFDGPKLRKLQGGSFRVPKRFQIDPPEKMPKAPPQS
jgi:hypothetical protein